MSSPLCTAPAPVITAGDLANGVLEPGQVFGLMGGPAWWGSAVRVTTGAAAGLVRLEREKKGERQLLPRYVRAEQPVYLVASHG